MMNSSMTEVTPIRAFEDNYIWCIRQGKRCAVVDPGDAKPVLAFLQQHQLTLTDILITHHHDDHIGGLSSLKDKFPDAVVYAANRERISHVDHCLSEGDKITLDGLSLQFEVFDVPGHTRDHIAFFGSVGLFCGDTLFSAGCGRLFEGSAEQMFGSLQKLAKLPANTKVYCAHEYTLANLRFASEVEPGNHQLRDYVSQAKQIRIKDQPTLPSTIARELSINPFLRCDQPEVLQRVAQHAGKVLHGEKDTFAALRSWKDQF
ncbi:hydroxyacylglutathione hydrolase [Neptunicella sp. SCSIO 80796]|uniref:hydroxyacylglutathione hydrolase n=1 Tax=Neptunicella plasticusilytica TaxID=3117012 RepID=UPI003A4D8400